MMRHLLILATLLLAGCATASAPDVVRARYLMGTICEIDLSGPAAADWQADAALVEIDRIERFLSTWKNDSELSRLNRASSGVPHEVSPELFDLLSTSMRISGETGGAFNPLVGRLVEIWRTRGEGTVPDAAKLRDAVARTSLSNVAFGSQTITLRNGAEFEEGGFGKGYAIDRAQDVLRRAGAKRALVNFGGQIGAYGFGDQLEVDIALPDDRDTPALRITTTDGSVSTSSGSEKTFAIGGRVFSHLIDPRSGEALPPRGSATVIADRALDADALSTALYVLGPDEGIAWADANGVALVFLTPGSQPHTFNLVTSRAARERIHGARILDPQIHQDISKGLIIK